MQELTKDLADKNKILLPEIFVPQILDADVQQEFQYVLERFRAIYFGVSIFENCLAGHKKIAQKLERQHGLSADREHSIGSN